MSALQEAVRGETWYNSPLAIVVVGASGDLAKKKTYPSLFELYSRGLLPSKFVIWGYARSHKTHQELRNQLSSYLPEECDQFLSHCYYKRGTAYGDVEAWKELSTHLEFDGESNINRLIYFAIPPNVFGETAVAARQSLRHSAAAWLRIIVEKPFGRDLASCRTLSKKLSAEFSESQLFRIDHYLGKEMVQNLLLWRFGNSIFEWIWHRDAIQSIHVLWKEPHGTEGRGGYFDNYGIIRDVIQNHLLQILSLILMEPPAPSSHKGASGGDLIRDAKLRLLDSMAAIEARDCLLGQYQGYTDDPTISNKESRCPTYALMRCHVRSPRWADVPILIEAGKALDERLCQVTITFHAPPAVPDYLYTSKEDSSSRLAQNTLVLRIQPNPSMYLTTNVKTPGFTDDRSPISVQKMELPYSGGSSSSSYATLILDVLRDLRGSFVREDELFRSWEIFDNLLKKQGQMDVQTYQQGSRGPSQRGAFLSKNEVFVLDEPASPVASL